MKLGAKSLLLPGALAAGWFLLALANGIGWAFKGGPIDRIVPVEALDYGVGFSVSLLLALVYSRIQKRLSAWPLVFTASLLCYCGGVAWRAVSLWAQIQVGLQKPFHSGPAVYLVAGGLMNGTTLGLFSFLYFAIHHWKQAAEQREKARQATALAHQAQLQMLRYQLNPHFLFNALNSIRAMIVEDPERSRQMVTELADFLRYSLDSEEQESTIGGELEAIENYLAIQRIRFEQQLDATVHADPAALGVAVPCFLIHPLVENAVKYGMETSAMPLRIGIEVVLNGQELDICVSNTGRLLESAPAPGRPPNGTGTGLKNITQRLNLVFPDRHSFRIWESDGWVRARIQIRLETRDSGHEVA